MNGNLADNYHEILNERKPTEKQNCRGGGGGEPTEIALEIHIKEPEGVSIMQLSLQLLRFDEVICYLTFCDDQFICLICISIFLISEVSEDSSLTGVGFLPLPYHYTYK